MCEQPTGSLTSFQVSVSLYLSNKGKTVLDDVLHSFSSCYGHDSRQEDIFEADVRPLIDVVYSGAVGSLQRTSYSQKLNAW
jgi:kinesin family member 22